jgi:hypothetical protein
MTPYGFAVDLVARLNAAGIKATVEPGKLSPPQVLVMPPDVDLDLACGGTASFSIMCVAPLNGDSTAWHVAERLVAKVLPHLEQPESVKPASFSPSDDIPAWPALVINASVNVDYEKV